MLEQILRTMNNWFVREIHPGKFTVEDGRLALPFLQDGQYFRIVGSVFNDGLHQYPTDMLTNETFNGSVWALAIPREVIKLSEDVAAWEEENGAHTVTGYQSESIPSYSYTRATNKDGSVLTWEDVFASQIRRWSKL